ncbi:MAG: hypothetical protein KDB21_09350 [Acidimicrobiales bacterium]|nr:hypothetical protein [Acidimicrobiales bacterium]
MRGKWAEGIAPRHFRWIVKDRLAISERPGGYGPHHRRVRRQEEIIWIRQQGFTAVVSLLNAPHNLHNYAELGMPALHWPFSGTSSLSSRLSKRYNDLADLLAGNNKLLFHHDELGDNLIGFVAGYLVWSGMIDEAPRAIVVVEQLTERQLGPEGREIVSVAARLASTAGAPPGS